MFRVQRQNLLPTGRRRPHRGHQVSAKWTQWFFEESRKFRKFPECPNKRRQGMKEWPRTKIQEYPLPGFHAIFFQQNVLKKPTSNKREPFYNTWNWKKRERKLESLQKNRTYCPERVTVALVIIAENTSWIRKSEKLFHPWKACLEPSRQKAGNRQNQWMPSRDPRKARLRQSPNSTQFKSNCLIM